MKTKYLNDDFKELGEPFLWGSLGLFVYPTGKRYFKENSIIENPDKKDWKKMYWDNHPRSAIFFGLGLFTGIVGLTNTISSGLEKTITENDSSQLLISGGILLGANLISAAYEIKKKYTNQKL